MRYCTGCSSEHQDSVGQCIGCGGTELVPADEMRRRGLTLPTELDTRRFARAAVTDDPLSAEQLAAVLESLHIPVFARPRRSGTVDNLSDPSGPWWEILVPEEHLGRASAVLAEERARMDASAEENARAAEAEAEAGTEAETHADATEPGEGTGR